MNISPNKNVIGFLFVIYLTMLIIMIPDIENNSYVFIIHIIKLLYIFCYKYALLNKKNKNRVNHLFLYHFWGGYI